MVQKLNLRTFYWYFVQKLTVWKLVRLWRALVRLFASGCATFYKIIWQHWRAQQFTSAFLTRWKSFCLIIYHNGWREKGMSDSIIDVVLISFKCFSQLLILTFRACSNLCFWTLGPVHVRRCVLAHAVKAFFKLSRVRVLRVGSSVNILSHQLIQVDFVLGKWTHQLESYWPRWISCSL